MLSDTAIRALKAKPQPYKVADEKGLHVLINPNGSKYFRLKGISKNTPISPRFLPRNNGAEIR